MPPKERSSVVVIKPEDFVLQCEWSDCHDVFNSMETFTPHITYHLMKHINFTSQEGAANELNDKRCHWQECNVEIDGDTADYLRHVYYHSFHVKIKCIGALLLQKTERPPCLYDAGNRNLIPDLPECLECGWDNCHARFENAEMFYQHVAAHADYYPEGNSVKSGCKCHWEGCEVTVKSKHKLKDHFKSHTQEKKVACPTCGALFSTRTKFFDHLSRQPGYNTGKQYQCSHCNSVFGAERLLREHMRYHVNQFKCPFCEMSSPSPSNMRLHIKYRHSDEKPHKCEMCDYRCKSVHDLKKHVERHSGDNLLVCDVPDCNYKTKSYRSLEHHFSRLHQRMDTSVYQCHVCDSSFTRGTMLTTHLKKKHKFNWPAGHSRFRYKRHSDGKWRLQTVRYESVEMTQLESPPSQSAFGSSLSQNANNAQSDNQLMNGSESGSQLLDMPNICETTPSGSGGIILVEKLDTPTSSESSGSQSSVCLVSVIDTLWKKKAQHIVKTKGQTGENSDGNDLDFDITDVTSDVDLSQDKPGTSLDESDNVNYDICIKSQSPVEEIDSEEAVEIHVVENEKGEYVIHRNSTEEDLDAGASAFGTVDLDTCKSMEFQQETMYNLQMLGEVALKDKYKD